MVMKQLRKHKISNAIVERRKWRLRSGTREKSRQRLLWECCNALRCIRQFGTQERCRNRTSRKYEGPKSSSCRLEHTSKHLWAPRKSISIIHATTASIWKLKYPKIIDRQRHIEKIKNRFAFPTMYGVVAPMGLIGVTAAQYNFSLAIFKVLRPNLVFSLCWPPQSRT